MFSSQSSARSKLYSRLELNDPTSSQGSLSLQRQESSSMSLGSQEPNLSSRDTQQSPVRKLYKIYTSKDSVFTKNLRNNEANVPFQEPIAKDDPSSIAVLNFLVKDLSEKCSSLNENIEKKIETALSNLLTEIENQLEQKNLDYLDQFSNHENNRIKIAELETIIHEKNETIESLKMDVAKLRQERENVFCQRFYEFLTSTLDTSLTKSFKLYSEEQVSRSKELELRIESKLAENIQEFKMILNSSKVATLVPPPPNKFQTPVLRTGNVRTTTGRKPKTSSLIKTPLEFIFKELNPPNTRQSSPFLQRLSYNADRRANLKATTPLSDIKNTFLSPISKESSPYGEREKHNVSQPLGKRSWRRRSVMSLASCEFTVAETSSEDLSFSSPEIGALKRKDLHEEDAVVAEDLGKMMIKKDSKRKSNRKCAGNPFKTKVKQQEMENDIIWA